MTLAYFSEKHKIAFADAFEAMTCGMAGFDFKEPALEEKNFDENGRLLERRFVHYGKPRLVERYDYEKGIVHKSFYEFGRQILQFTLPIYNEQELRAKHTPIKERVQGLSFVPEQVTKISVLIKSTDKIGGIQQETWHGCDGYFEKAHRTAIRKITYDEKGNIYASDEYLSNCGEQMIIRNTFDGKGNEIFRSHSYEEETLSSTIVSLYDNKNRVIQRINTNRYGGYRDITCYTYKKNEVIRNKIFINTPEMIDEESSKRIEKIGSNTCETIRTIGIPEKEEVTISDLTGRILGKTETYYYDIDKGEELRKWEEEYTYNEAGVLIKEVRRYVDYESYISDSYYNTETILYNGQGQKIERNEKSEDKNYKENIRKQSPQGKDKVFLEKSLYYYNEQGDLIREDLRKWCLNDGVETFSVHHFYEREDEYEAHLEITLKNPN
ncbi:hypothetical protein [Capnocytophaga gingivalis]